MKEINGNIFELIKQPEYNAICIPTNGVVDTHQNAVMGAGLALKLKELCDWFPTVLGVHLKMYGNIPFIRSITELNNKHVITFPTKHNWKDKSDMQLIRQSALIIEKYALLYDLNVLLPRVGAGLGKLDWWKVKLEIQYILSDRFTVVNYEG